MKRIWQTLLWGIVLTAGMASLGTTVVRADDYWNNHWRWYDNSYRPYYYNHPYYYSPYNSGGYRYYGPSPYYGNSYYYSAPPAYYYGGGGVQLGPLRFGWW